jgi:Family of unknown function (DUF5829)
MRKLLAILAGAAAAATWSGASDPPSPPVFLNHFYAVIDSASYRALQDSAFVTGELAPFEKRTTTRNDQTYTGIYWYGRRTYFEVFEPESQGPVGACGIALGVDATGGGALVKALWAASFGGADTGLVTRKTEDAEPPWFEMTYAKAPSGGLRLWLMEYHQDFLARWYPDLTPARGVTRAEVLDRYVAKIARSAQRETALVKDVTGLVIALAPADRELLHKHLVPVGWSPRAEKDAAVFEGPEGVTLRVVETAPGRRGILEATFSLQRKAAPRTETLGTIVLTVEPERASLRFGT